MSEWISVITRVPEKGVDVLVYSAKYNYCTAAHWIDAWKEWRDSDDEVVEGISHWQYLPATPEVEQ